LNTAEAESAHTDAVVMAPIGSKVAVQVATATGPTAAATTHGVVGIGATPSECMGRWCAGGEEQRRRAQGECRCHPRTHSADGYPHNFPVLVSFGSDSPDVMSGFPDYTNSLEL
jgi:hypothetical protein